MVSRTLGEEGQGGMKRGGAGEEQWSSRRIAVGGNVS